MQRTNQSIGKKLVGIIQLTTHDDANEEDCDPVEQQHRPQWSNLREWIDPLSIVVIVLVVAGALIFVVGYLRPSPLLQALGAIGIGAGLSALIGALTGRWAIHQQSAKEANVWRKEHTYGPLYVELKAVSRTFSEVNAGKAPSPQRIDTGAEMESGFDGYLLSRVASPTLKCWPEFQQDYRDIDFKPTTQRLLDDVQTLATTYNNAVEPARQAAIPILAQHIDAAIGAAKQSAKYQQWKRQQVAHDTSPALAGHELQTTYDWFGHFEDALGSILAIQWLTHWPAGVAPSRSLALGWLLAKQQDEAASYVQRNYPGEGAIYPRPPLDFIQPIFEQARPALQQDTAICAAIDAGKTLYQHVQAAEGILADGLRQIQKRFQGGDPFV